MGRKRAFIVCWSFLILLINSVASPQNVQTDRKNEIHRKLARKTVSSADFISTGKIDFFIRNDGLLAADPDRGHTTGLYYPGGQRAKSVLYTGGLWFMGQVNGEIRSANCQYSTEYQPGQILSPGVADDPEDSKYTVYKYRQGDTVSQEAIDQGAPSEVLADEMLYCVFNDLGTHEYLNDTAPLGIEVHQTLEAYSSSGLENIIFMTYEVINKSTETIDSAYVALFLDPDLGNANDDYIGSDTTLDMVYVYNGDGYDDRYGVQAPALALNFLQGPLTAAPGETAVLPDGRQFPDRKFLGMSAAMFYI